MEYNYLLQASISVQLKKEKKSTAGDLDNPLRQIQSAFEGKTQASQNKISTKKLDNDLNHFTQRYKHILVD